MIEPQKWASTLGSLSDTVTLPDEDLQFASFKKLFPALTQVPLSEGGVAPQRTDFNTLFKLLGDNIFYLQQGGVFSYSDTADYERGAFVKYNNELYLCIQDNNSLNKHAPTDAEYWLRVALNNELADYLPLAGGNVTGNLTVQNKNLVRSVNGVNADANGNVLLIESGDNWVRFANGTQICNFVFSTISIDQSINYPMNFSSPPVINLTNLGSNAQVNVFCKIDLVNNISFAIRANTIGTWHCIAVGKWK